MTVSVYIMSSWILKKNVYFGVIVVVVANTSTFTTANGASQKSIRGSVAEWSKALDLGSSL